MQYADCELLKIGTKPADRHRFWVHVEQNINFYINTMARPLAAFQRDPRFRPLWARFRMIRQAIIISARDVAPLASDIGVEEAKIYDALSWIVLEVVDTHRRTRIDIIKELKERC